METVYADKLYQFLSEIATAAQSQGDERAFLRIDAARRHYMASLSNGKSFRLPLTSEFLGEAMDALREVLETSESLFTADQAKEAREYVEAIKQQWFSPP